MAAQLDPAEVSRRLKAARWLAGGIDDKGKPTPLTPPELAQNERLIANKITANTITEIEQLIRVARPMELRELALALGVGSEWFSSRVARPAELRGVLEQLLAGLDLASDQAPPETKTEPGGGGHPK